MDELLEQMISVYTMMGKKEFAEAIAKMLWNIYRECIAKGFELDEAMAITLSFAKSQSGK